MATSPKEIVSEAIERASVAIDCKNALPVAASQPPRPGLGSDQARFCEVDRNNIHRITGRDPGVQATMQRSDPFEPVVHQKLRNLGGGGLVWTGAVGNNLTVAG